MENNNLTIKEKFLYVIFVLVFFILPAVLISFFIDLDSEKQSDILIFGYVIVLVTFVYMHQSKTKLIDENIKLSKQLSNALLDVRTLHYIQKDRENIKKYLENEHSTVKKEFINNIDKELCHISAEIYKYNIIEICDGVHDRKGNFYSSYEVLNKADDFANKKFKEYKINEVKTDDEILTYAHSLIFYMAQEYFKEDRKDKSFYFSNYSIDSYHLDYECQEIFDSVYQTRDN